MKAAIADWEAGNLSDVVFQLVIDNLVYDMRAPSAKAIAMAQTLMEKDKLEKEKEHA